MMLVSGDQGRLVSNYSRPAAPISHYSSGEPEWSIVQISAYLNNV